MTDGTSQGLFIVVAIVIFGIFVVMAYILFEDTLSPAMANMFNTVMEQSTVRLSNETEVKYFVYEKIKGDTEIRIVGYTGNEDGIFDVRIPNYIEELPVTTISNNSFTNKGLRSVKLPDTLSVIEDGYHSGFPNSSGAFAHNNLDNLHIPKNITYIGMDTFAKNPLTKGVTYAKGKSVDLRGYAFWDTGLKEAFIPDRVIALNGSIFEDSNSITSFRFEGTRIDSLNAYFFEGNNLTGVVKIPEGITGIKNRALSNNPNMTELHIPRSVTLLEHDIVVLNYKLKKVRVPEHLRNQIENNPQIFRVYGNGTHEITFEYF